MRVARQNKQYLLNFHFKKILKNFLKADGVMHKEVLAKRLHLNGCTVLLVYEYFFDSKVRKHHFVHNNKQHHRKVLLSSFHLNGHTLGFHPQTQKLEPPCTA